MKQITTPLGITQTETDARYVKKTGDTMTGPLDITNAPVSGTPGNPTIIKTGDPNTPALVLQGNTTSSYPLTVSTAAYYKFDENTGSLVADSASTNDGTWQGTLGSQWTTGLVNSGGNFNGSDNYVDLGPTTFLNGVNKAYFFTTFDTTGLNANKTLMARWNFSTQGQIAIQLDATSATNIRVFVADSIGDTGGNFMQSLNANLTANNRYHIVVAYDGTLAAVDRIKIYVNAVLCTTQPQGTIPTSLTSPTANFRIGQFQGLGREWLGMQDEVGIGLGNITQAQVTALYNNGAGNQYGGITQVSPLLKILSAANVLLSYLGANGELVIAPPNTTSALVVNNSAGTRVLTVDTLNKMLGIGISNPTSRLSIGLAGGFTQNVAGESQSVSESNDIVFGIGNVSQGMKSYMRTRTLQNGSDTDGEIVWYTTHANVGAGERMFLDRDGNLGIGGAPNANAILDLQSTTKAFMPPRATTTQIGAVASPTEGMMMYDTTLHKLSYYNGTVWVAV